MKKMLINAIHPEEIRVAVVEDGLLKELYVESSLKEQLRGNIYKGRIGRVEPSLHAVFVDFGREKNGFLPMHDVNPALIPNFDNSKTILKSLHRGMEIPVQVNREEKADKGALLTMNLSLPGRYMVLLPQHNLAGISRKIEDETQRTRLKEIIKQLNVPVDMGLIVRTAGMDKKKTELSKDINYLQRLWKSIDSDFAKAPCPGMLYREGDIIIRSIRDYFTTDISEILVDDEDTYKRASLFLKSVIPRQRKLIKQYKDSKSLFTKYDLENQIAGIYNKTIRLKSGGNIVIESTEAMVTIDVNSAKSTMSKDIENTALSTNLEAASEIARQLILRDLGGLIVIDFIDMRPREHNRQVEKALRVGLKHDRAHIVFGRISQFGLLEMSRERLSPPLLEKSHVPCAICEGTGLLRSVESSAFMALRDINLSLNRNKSSKIKVGLPEDVAIYILNRQRKHLMLLESKFSTEISIYTVQELKRGQVKIEPIGNE
ncbi:MAG: ribonuclease E/G [Deltaproteobacteria bacterium]|nr:ribonuclease E/G [Deltaproteobacteria bacterium]